MLSTIRELRSSMKDGEEEAERRRRELIDKCNHFEAEARKHKEEYQRICDILKSKINETINNVSFKK
jgi:Sec-independent protein translocase protein TatA